MAMRLPAVRIGLHAVVDMQRHQCGWNRPIGEVLAQQVQQNSRVEATTESNQPTACPRRVEVAQLLREGCLNHPRLCGGGMHGEDQLP
jgi:DNA-binding NarL/FixJ family response regulator